MPRKRDRSKRRTAKSSGRAKPSRPKETPEESIHQGVGLKTSEDELSKTERAGPLPKKRAST